MNQKYSIEEITGQIKSLPIIDKSVLEIISILNQPQSNFEVIVEKLSPDLTAQFLKMANMASYGREVRSINYAVRLLGFKEMKHILVSSILIDHLVRRLDVRYFSFEKFQVQAHFCAAVSRILGEILNYAHLEDLFTVSILHNIGKLIIVVYFNEAFHKINTLKQEKNIPAREAELAILGASHSAIGALVLERFKIPGDICDAVRFHDDRKRSIEQSRNYELEFIFREAASIVAGYVLPENMAPMEIVKKMAKTIARGRENCLAETRSKIRSRGYAKVFSTILSDASDLVRRDLKEILDQRLDREGENSAPV
jgi:HD-like signal output (HDOD) protein